jgi:hypothetical protein
MLSITKTLCLLSCCDVIPFLNRVNSIINLHVFVDCITCWIEHLSDQYLIAVHETEVFSFFKLMIIEQVFSLFLKRIIRYFTIITLLPFFIEMLQYDWLWSGHMIIKEMFYIPIKLKPELARASMTTSDVNNQWRSNFQQQII